MHTIVITDADTLNPGDLSWKQFESLGEVIIFDKTGEEIITERCKAATVIITNKTPISKSTIEAAHKLKVIAVTATGYNVIDVDAAKKNQILVCNVPAYGTDSVAQHTFALLLELTNHVGKNTASVSKGDWSKSNKWCYSKSPIIELSGKTLGLIGYGKIGQKVAELARAFGMKIIYFRPSAKTLSHSMEEIFQQSDFVSLHCPLKSDNHSFVNERLLSLMKPSAFLINTSRGQLINESDLALALKDRKIAGAALDVLSMEPPLENNPLIGLLNCIITPHTAWLSFEARKRIMEATFANVQSALNSKPQNVVNP